MATAKIEVPEVYAGIASVLKYLSVDKNGVLPGNMGGKAYLTAHDVAAEVKTQFVKNNLIFLPSEEIISEEHIVHKDRLNIRVLVKGTYRIVSTVDGSEVSVSGLGDGLATGTAVASNIGSTNALKNALLRTFLITEQAVEDGMMKDVANAEAATAPAATGALGKARAKATAKPEEKKETFRAKVQSEFGDKMSRDELNALHSEVKASDPKLTGDKVFEEMYKNLTAS